MKTVTDRGTLLQIYRDIKRRCYNPRSVIYSTYGAKGITVCDEWLNDRESFIKWCMENGYRKGLSVSRIDTGMGYSPDNCIISDMSKKRSDSVKSRAGRKKRENLSLYGVTGKTKHPLWKKYFSMHNRCKNKSHPSYNNYGGRGIKVCAEWSGEKGYENFYKWAKENGWENGLSLERLDNDKGYCPQNCTWIPLSEQPKNRRNTHYYCYNGEKMNLADICKKEGLKYSQMYSRVVMKKMAVEEAVKSLENIN